MRWLLPALLLVAAASVGAAAQETTPRQSVLQRLFPHPTGRNGYEDLVAAGELISGNAALEAAVQPNATLETKRAALSDPALRRALDLVRKGLAKPIQGPADRQGPNGGAPEFPDMALLRGVARMLGVQEYVQLADGRVGEAVDTLRDCLLLGYAVQSDALMGSLVGVAINAIGLRPLAGRLDQLSARNCERVIALAIEWLKVPDPAIGAMQSERRYAVTMLGGRANDASISLADAPEWKEVSALITVAFDNFAAALRQPAWERKPVAVPTSPNATVQRMFEQVWQLLAQPMSQVQDKWTADLAQIQLLGVHAAIRRYRWENDRLPASLDELKLGALALDPFTGKPLSYRTTSPTTFELTSAGPLARDEQGNPIGDQRVPLMLGGSKR